MTATTSPELEAFSRYLAAAGLSSKHSRRAYVGVVRRQIASGMDALAWATEQLAGDVPSGTAAQVRAALRHWRTYRGELAIAFPRGPRRRRRHRDPMSAGQLASYYRKVRHDGNMSPQVRVVLALLPRTGLRVSEACEVRRQHLRRRDGTLGLFVARGKGGHERFVPLTAEARRLLELYLLEHPPAPGPLAYLFPGDGLGAHVHPDTLRVALRRIRGDQPWTPHVLRHTFASRFYEATGDLLTLSEILGHRSLETTREYVQASARRKRVGMEAAELPPPPPRPRRK